MTDRSPQLIGLILAGGRSSRMGLDQPKPSLDVGGRTMAARAADRLRPFVRSLLVATDRPDLHADLNASCIADSVPGYAGPLAGLQAAACRALEIGASIVSAPGDTPFLPEDLVPRLIRGMGADELRVVEFAGRLHPVCALWPPAALERLTALRLESDKAPSLQSVMREHGFTAVPFPADPQAPGGDPFFNVNTPADLAAARAAALSRG